MAVQDSSGNTGPIVLVVSGMTCGGCAGAVSRALAGIPGVVQARVDLSAGRATVTGTAPAQELIRALEAAGFGGELA